MAAKPDLGGGLRGHSDTVHQEEVRLVHASYLLQVMSLLSLGYHISAFLGCLVPSTENEDFCLGDWEASDIAS